MNEQEKDLGAHERHGGRDDLASHPAPDAASHAAPFTLDACGKQHPNAPWRVSAEDQRNHGAYGYAVLDRDGDAVSDHSCLPNAYLIAAAPELLEAIKAVVTPIAGGSWRNLTGENAQKALAAIAKAEGRA